MKNKKLWSNINLVIVSKTITSYSNLKIKHTLLLQLGASQFSLAIGYIPLTYFWIIKMKSTLMIFNYVNVITMYSFFYIQYLIFCFFFVHNQFFGDGYECGEGSHKYNKCKTLIMVVSKIMLPPYHPQMMKEKKITYYKYAI